MNTTAAIASIQQKELKARQAAQAAAAPAQPAAPAASVKESDVKKTVTKAKAADKAPAKRPDVHKQIDAARQNARTPTKAKGDTWRPRPGTKSEIAFKMLTAKNGATQAELAKATGWPRTNVKLMAEQAKLSMWNKGERWYIGEKA